MATISRAGTGLLLVGGLLLAALMGYALILDDFLSPPSPAPRRPAWPTWRSSSPAVTTGWISAGVSRPATGGPGPGRPGDGRGGGPEDPRYGRLVRFSWLGTRGLVETRDEVRRLAGGIPPPVAVVGSTTPS